MYNFYYDETEHSRKINYETVTASNYYDNFITAIVGWPSEKDASISEKYLAFEAKYEYRKKKGELKSQTMRKKDFMLGFASLNKNTIEFYEDLISLFDERIITYVSVSSKIEYVINQLFVGYHNSTFVDVDSMKYSIIKTINVYRPQKVIEAIYKDARTFVDELRAFLVEQINKNHANMQLKSRENNAFQEIVILLNEVELPETLDWSYFAPFDGFKKLLTEMGIDDYKLLIDQEGDASHTSNSARIIGLQNVTEEDSKEHVGIRIADMFVGLISRVMQSLKTSLTGDYRDGKIEKTLLNTGWFALNQRQLDLYKKLYKVICEDNNYWYKAYSGIYSDDLVAFVALLQYMNQFESVDKIRNGKLEMQPEYYNAFVCKQLEERYRIMRNKSPLVPVMNDNKEYYYNQKGAKVYKCIEKQQMLPIHEGQDKYYVLSVGFEKSGVPLVTILENGEPICYRLPDEYYDWAMTVVGMANAGEIFFPVDVIFSLVAGRYCADIL